MNRFPKLNRRRKGHKRTASPYLCKTPVAFLRTLSPVLRLQAVTPSLLNNKPNTRHRKAISLATKSPKLTFPASSIQTPTLPLTSIRISRRYANFEPPLKQKKKSEPDEEHNQKKKSEPNLEYKQKKKSEPDLEHLHPLGSESPQLVRNTPVFDLDSIEPNPTTFSFARKAFRKSGSQWLPVEEMEQEDPLVELRRRAAATLENPEDEIYLEEAGLRRLLVARENNVDLAFEMWTRWVNWRKTYRAEQITEAEIAPILETGKAFWRGIDKNMRPCLIIRARYHWPNEFSLDETMRYIIYMIEQGVKIADESGTGQVCVLYDRGGMVAANKDNNLISMVREMSGMLEDYYAERLSAFYVIHVNWWYYMMYEAAKALIKRRTRNKLHVMNGINGLLDHFESDELMVEYGGTDEYVHPYPN